MTSSDRDAALRTPDGRYLIVDGRLWRATNPDLEPARRDALVSELMSARRAVRDASCDEARRGARARVDAAKHALGERGAPWWTDGAPDENRRKIHDSSYAAWHAAIAQDR